MTVNRKTNRTLYSTNYIDGIAILKDKLYLGNGYKPMQVYDSLTLRLLHNLSIPGHRCVSDMTSCPKCHVLYVADECSRMVHVIDDSGLRHQWNLSDAPVSVSVNSHLNVVITFADVRKLREFTPTGQLLREITLQSDVIHPTHAVQLDDNQYAVVHGWLSDNLHRVCIVSSNGTVTKSYGDSPGPCTGELDVPRRMLVVDDSMILADEGSSRLLLFDVSSLTFIRELIQRHRPAWPHWNMALSEDSSELFVSFHKEIRVFSIAWV